MESKPVVAALLLLGATFLPGLLSKLPAGALSHCSDRSRIEWIDPARTRGALAVARCPLQLLDCAGSTCAVRAPRGAARLLLGHRIDLETARPAELQALPGIGPGLARRIVAARERRGSLGSLDGLRGVKGFGVGRIGALVGWARAGPGP